MFNRALNHEGKRRPGWIFSLKSKGDLEGLGLPFHGSTISVESKSSEPSGGDLKKPMPVAPYCVMYSDKSFAILGDSRKFKEDIKAIGGKVIGFDFNVFFHILVFSV